MVGDATENFVAFSRDAIEQSIPARFEQQVERHPERLAVRTSAASLTYRQLDQLANRIAHGVLARLGEGVEPVCLLMSQSVDLLAAILGVLKAGKLYVPMERSHPAARTEYVREDTKARLVLTDATGSAADPRAAGDGPISLPVDEILSGQPDHTPGLRLDGDTLAYVYYTSGSTGRPKGVLDNHRNVLHNILRYTNSLRVTSQDRLSLLQSPSFSGAASSLFTALLNGASVFPYDLAREGLGQPLARWLQREEITIYHSVPMVFRSFLRGGLRFPSVRVVRLEGDLASMIDVELFRRHFDPGCRLVNGLGATEAGISRQFFLDHSTRLSGGIVPVGYPTSDMHVSILDESGHQVEAGSTGQIAVRSRYLALGYWKLPELTRARFLSGDGGERTYLTGDLGRIRADGCLEFLGRIDLDRKIGGHRVEPAEVEAALLGLEEVREAAVVTRVDRRGHPRLVAYVVPRGASTSGAALRGQLAERLPAYMVPSRITLRDDLPLTANGKVDREALRGLVPGPITPASDPAVPQDPLERRLVRIWEEILDTRPVGVTDDFFDLGGDSVLTEDLLLALEETTPWELTPHTIATAPTIRQLAAILGGRSAPSSAGLVSIQKGGGLPTFFCFPGHDGHLSIWYARLARCLSKDQPVLGLQPPGLAGDRSPLTSIETLARWYADLIREHQPHGPYHLGGSCFGGLIAFAVAQEMLARGATVGLLYLTHVTPEDFPGLASESARRRFRRNRLVSRVTEPWKQIRRRPFRKRGLYIAREVVRGVRHQARGAVIRFCLAGGRPLPPRFWDVGLVSREALRVYAPRPYPGRVTLALRVDDQRLYDPEPRRDWGRLAERYDVAYVTRRGPEEEKLLLVGEHLEQALRAARA